MQTPRANTLNKMLRDRFDLEVDLSSDLQSLRAVMEHYLGRRASILETQGEMAAVTSSEYSKAYLISETVRMYLREIAPKRMRKRKSN